MHDLEGEMAIPPSERPLYVLYGDTSGQWRVQAVALTPDSFDSRKALPEPWRGVRDEALSTVCTIPGCVFVHASGFIGGNTTRGRPQHGAQGAGVARGRCPSLG